jgi:hypothetical protein
MTWITIGEQREKGSLRTISGDRLIGFMYYPIRLIYEAIELGMHTAKKKPMTKKEREEKRKKRKEKEKAK